MTQKTKEQLAVEFVENFVKYGFRIDTMPTRMFMGGQSAEAQAAVQGEYMWWSKYVTEAQKRLSQEAQSILSK